METSFSFAMAIMDYIPVFGFLLGAYFLAKIFFIDERKPFGLIVIIGGTLIFLGGALQATWKLFMALNL